MARKITDTERLDKVFLFLNKASVYGLAGKRFTRRGVDSAIRASRKKSADPANEKEKL